MIRPNNYNVIEDELDLKNNTNKMRTILRKNIINIDSNNRQKIIKLITEPIQGRIGNNGITVLSKHRIQIYHPNHGFEISNMNIQVILNNVEGNYKNDKYLASIGGIPLNYINYDTNIGFPIHSIEIVPKYISGILQINASTKIIESYYYIIKLKETILDENIDIGSIGGGNNIEVLKVLDTVQGYKYASKFIIPLGKKLENIISARLISIELLNTQLAIQNAKPYLEVDDNLVKKSDFNNSNDTIYWINEDDKTKKYNVSLISDSRINNKIILKDNTDNITTIQTSQGVKLNTFIDINEADMYIPVELYNNVLYWPLNYLRSQNSLFSSYIKTTYLNYLATELLSVRVLILEALVSKNIPITSINTFLYNLNNVSNISTLLTFITIYIIASTNTIIVGNIKNNESPPVLIINLVDKTIKNMLHKYLNKTTELYSNYNYYNTTMVKLYSCYWETYELIKNINYYVSNEVNELGKIKITPLTNNSDDIYKIIPSRTLNDVNEYTIYPIYKIILSQSAYTAQSFITETENKFNSIHKLIYNYNTMKYENKILLNKLSIRIQDEYHNFKVNLDKDNGLVSIQQYKDIYNYSTIDITNDESGPFIMNDQYNNIFINHKGHNLKTGDIISIENCTRLSNILVSQINKEHIVKVDPVYTCKIRLMLGIPNTELLLSGGKMNKNTTTGEYYFNYGMKTVSYSSYLSGDAPNYIGSQLIDNTVNIFKINELILKIEQLNQINISLGRICSIEDCDANGNIGICYTLLSGSNFNTGDVIVSSDSRSIGMIIPINYGDNLNSNEIGLPLYSELSGLDNDITLIKNGSIGYSIITTIIPNKTILDGIGGTNVNIRQPVSCSLLLNNNDTPYEALGFKKENTEFAIQHTNTEKVNKIYIDYSYLENNTSNKIINRNVIIKTKSDSNFQIGSRIYIDNHSMNTKILKDKPTIQLQIDSYEPFSGWLNKFTEIEQSNINTWIDNNIDPYYIPDTGGFNTINASIYLGSKIIIYYIVPYTNNQTQDLGNMGNNIDQFDKIDLYDYKLESTLINIYGIKEGEYIYIYKNNKNVRILDKLTSTGLSTGIPDGYYKVLTNLTIQTSAPFFPHLNKSINSVIIDLEYIDTLSNNISNGFLNRGYIRAPAFNTEIVGYNKTHTKITTTFSISKTAGTKLITIPRTDAANFTKGYIIILNGLYIDNTTTFIDNKYSRTNIETIESNIIDTITDDPDNINLSIIRCIYNILYDHTSGEVIYRYNYITSLNASVVSGTNIITVNISTPNTNNIIVGQVIKIDWNKQISSMTEPQTQLYIEDINYITSVAVVSGNIQITLKYNLINSHNSGINIVIFNKQTENNMNSTQLIYINSKWYTRLFYNGVNSIYDRQYDGDNLVIPSTSSNIVGQPIINPYLTNNLYIDDNNGYYIPHTNLVNSNIVDTIIDIIMPIPPDYYDTYTYNDEDIIYKNTNTSIPINGLFVNNLWVNDIDIVAYEYFLNYNSITIEGKYTGFSGHITQHFKSTDTLINTHNGILINDIESIIENGINYDLIKLNLSSDMLNINPPNNMITPLIRLTNHERRDYKIGFGGIIYQKKLLKPVNVEGDNYIYLSIKYLDNIITNNFTTSETAFAKILLNSRIGNNIFNSFINTQKDFTEGLLPKLEDIEVTFFNENGKLYDFNNQEVSFTLEIITQHVTMDTININSNHLQQK